MQPHNNITRHIKLNMTSAALIGLLTFFCATGISAQTPPPPPPPPGYGHGSNQNQRPGQGGDAPLGSGLALLIGMTAIYGTWKFKRGKDGD